jgi:cardiolipin synthase
MSFQDLADWFPLHGLLSAVGLLVYTVGSHALHQRRHPSAAVAWVMAILLVPEAGLPLYLLFGTRKLPKAQARPSAAPAEVDDAVAPRWARHLTASMGLAPAAGYRALRVHRDGPEAARALHQVIDSARESLDVCTFILGRDRFAADLVERLGRRARDGVRVRLIVDGVGALMGGRRDFAEVQALGVKVIRFVPPFRSPLKWPLRGRTNLRNHRKLVVADGRWLWSGGRNLAGEYFEDRPAQPAWVDLSFDLQGDAAAEAAAVFDADWRFAQDPRQAAMGPSGAAPDAGPPPAAAPPAAQLLPSGPDDADDTVHTLLVTSFHRARNRIVAVTPYLVPDESLLSAMALAARRGVVVDLVVPARSNHRLADIARNRPMRELARAGARIWLLPRMLHAKAVVIDDHMAMVGSVNLDSRSLFLNYELMTAFYAPGDIGRFTQWIDGLIPEAGRYEARAPNLARYAGEGLVLWLAFQL